MRLVLTCRTLAEGELQENNGKWFPYLRAIRYSSADGLTIAVEYVTLYPLLQANATHSALSGIARLNFL